MKTITPSHVNKVQNAVNYLKFGYQLLVWIKITSLHADHQFNYRSLILPHSFRFNLQSFDNITFCFATIAYFCQYIQLVTIWNTWTFAKFSHLRYLTELHCGEFIRYHKTTIKCCEICNKNLEPIYVIRALSKYSLSTPLKIIWIIRIINVLILINVS